MESIMKIIGKVFGVYFFLYLALTGLCYGQLASGQDNRLEWQPLAEWPLDDAIIDMVHSLDGKYLFVLNTNGEVKVYNSQGQLQGTIPVGKGVAAIDIAPQGEVLYLVDNNAKKFSAVNVSFVVDVDITGAPVRGPADAPVTIVLFTDFECPYCKKVVPLLEQVLEKNPKTVKLAFKNMPLRFHKMAEPSARAALAADEQGKFWEFHDRLFSAPKLSEAVITKTAEDLGLDMKRFTEDRNSTKTQARLQKDLLDAQKAGVTGTPTIYINGRTPLQRSLEGFQAIINDELRKKGGK
jgi:protein-disulfide isomerase